MAMKLVREGGPQRVKFGVKVGRGGVEKKKSISSFRRFSGLGTLFFEFPGQKRPCTPVLVSSRPILASNGGTEVFLPHFSANSKLQFFPLKPFCHLKVFALFGRFRASPPPLADSSEKISTEPPVFVTSPPPVS